MNTDSSATPTRHWRRLDDGRVQCDVCPRHCRLHEGQRGLCFVRGRDRNGIELYTYGRSSGFCVDPIEKKPLNHFLPGSAVLSFGTAGCNLACKLCQNWAMSKSREMDTLADVEAAMASDVTVGRVYLVPPRWLIKSSAGKPSRRANRERALSELTPVGKEDS